MTSTAPGDILLVNDPPDANGLERVTCDGQRAPGDLGDRISAIEHRGRQKLVVAMPDLGGVIVVDADELLKRPVGSYDPCKVERWIPLQVDLTGLGDPQPPPSGTACSNQTSSTGAMALPEL